MPCMRRCRGGYAVVAMVIGPRDPRISRSERHPSAGDRQPRDQKGHRMDAGVGEASRSTCRDSRCCAMWRPARRWFIDEQGRFYAQQCVAMARHTPCIFEVCPISRDPIRSSTIFRSTRRACGWASGWPRKSNAKGRTTTSTWSFRFRTPAVPPRAGGAAAGRQVPRGVHQEPLHRPYLHLPGQEQRSKSVRSKLNAIDLEFRGKTVLLVDDSIVRGTTSAQIIDMRRGGRRQEGVFRLGRAAGALPQRLRHRHAGHVGTGGGGPHGR